MSPPWTYFCRLLNCVLFRPTGREEASCVPLSLDSATRLSELDEQPSTLDHAQHLMDKAGKGSPLCHLWPDWWWGRAPQGTRSTGWAWWWCGSFRHLYWTLGGCLHILIRLQPHKVTSKCLTLSVSRSLHFWISSNMPFSTLVCCFSSGSREELFYEFPFELCQLLFVLIQKAGIISSLGSCYGHRLLPCQHPMAEVWSC